jgi:hypothetical protein
MTNGAREYLYSTPLYAKGWMDGYNVAKQEVKDFQEAMGKCTNTFTGTSCTCKESQCPTK